MAPIDAAGRGWRNPILAQFTPELAGLCPITVLRDPDGLMADPSLVSALAESGFTVIVYDDPLALRLFYEQRARAVSGGGLALVVVMAGDTADLPWDLLQRAMESGRVIELAVSNVLPGLSPLVLRKLEPDSFDGLFEATDRFQPGVLSDNATAEFALRHLFRVAPELVTSDSDLLVALIRLHFGGLPLPAVLADRLVALLAPRFPTWPVDALVRSASTLWRFLDERWPVFLCKTIGHDDGAQAAITVSGPRIIPFDHPDVRVYVDDLFLDGRLTRTVLFSKVELPEQWMQAGVEADEQQLDAEIRLAELTSVIRHRLPAKNGTHHDWFAFARLWAEWLVTRHRLAAGDVADKAADLAALHDEVEQRFGDWMIGQFGALHSVSCWPRPVMVHQIDRYLAYTVARALPERRRLALVVLDGLALDQWLVLKDGVLRSVGDRCNVEETAIFAWVPTLTSISRQAIFAGQLPAAFGSSLRTTSKEETWWRSAWMNEGSEGREVGFVRQREHEPDGDFCTRVREVAESPAIYRLGVVVNTLDTALHDAGVESSWLHAMLERWKADGHPGQLLSMLVDNGFDVHLTADHGNIEARGMGKPNAGDVPEIRGSRVFTFPDPYTRDDQAARFPTAIKWPGAGLPPGYFPLIAPRRCAFMSEGARAVTHGGISIEEVIVPFVSFTRERS